VTAQPHRLDTQALGTAAAALIGVALLPWYAIEDGFWALKWLLHGYPLAAESAPALFLWLKGANLWLLPVAGVALATLAAVLLRPPAAVLGRLLVFLGTLGIAYLLAQGFLFGLKGWNAAWLNAWFGESEQRQFGMGYGALLTGASFFVSADAGAGTARPGRRRRLCHGFARAGDCADAAVHRPAGAADAGDPVPG
jgi:iron(III) transport system permease protein